MTAPELAIAGEKVQSRILDNGVFADRDLYDLLVAAELDQEALRRVLASITAEERAMIASELRALPRDRSISEPIREPTYSRLVPDLARRAGRLFDVDNWRGRTRRRSTSKPSGARTMPRPASATMCRAWRSASPPLNVDAWSKPVNAASTRAP